MYCHARPFALAIAGSLALLAAPDTATAQFGKRLKDAVTRNAENRAIHEVIQQENKAIDVALTAGLSSGDDAAGGALYEELTASGRVTAEGVSFEPGTATMTEGSAPALKAIGSMLKSHADLKVSLEAYAPDKQVAAARADAVKQSLVKAYSVDELRVKTSGYAAKTGERLDIVQQ
jgi:outer membrane protein OmpA-like peptidoglycan-associated protein